MNLTGKTESIKKSTENTIRW